MASDTSASEEVGVSVLRADIAGIEQLMCAYNALQEFVDMETDPEDAEDVAKANSILAQIEELIAVEAQEPNDNAEPADMGMNSDRTIPRENIVRAILPGARLRSNQDGSRTLHGHFAKFNEWTEIKSMQEGHFMERIAPGAFTKTFRENRGNIKVLFDHGHDPSIGNKPLGPIRDLKQDGEGAYYEVDMLDTSYNRDLIPALEAGLLGASFRFRVTREDFNRDAEESDWNPNGIPERTIREASVAEFGPVTFPAYAGATAGVRSMTDDYVMRRFLEQPDSLRALLLDFLPAASEDGAEGTPPADDGAEPEAHPVIARRSTTPIFGMNKETKPSWRI